MQVPVLLEPIADDGFRARTGEPFALSAEGATREDALKKVRELIEDRLAGGVQLVNLQIPASQHPLAKWAGTWKEGDPLIEEWKKAVEEYRQEIEDDPDR